MMREAAAIQRLADRFVVRLAAEKACETAGLRLASVSAAGLTPEVVAAFGEHFYLPQYEGKVAFGNLVRKLKQLVDGFKRLPRLWDKFKEAIGVQKLSDLPGAIKNLASLAVKSFRKILHRMFETWPLKLYTLEKGKLASFNDVLNKIVNKSDKFRRFLDKAVSKVIQFGEMVRQQAPRIVGVVMVAIYIWVWFNVVEFEWNIKDLTDAVTGNMTFPEFMATLPGSAFGFLLTFFNFGTFTLLPASIVARVMYLMKARYVTWTGTWFKVDWDLLHKDFGIAEQDVLDPMGALVHSRQAALGTLYPRAYRRPEVPT